MRGAGFIERMEVGIQPGRILRLGFSGLQTENRVRRAPGKNAFGSQYGTGFGSERRGDLGNRIFVRQSHRRDRGVMTLQLTGNLGRRGFRIDDRAAQCFFQHFTGHGTVPEQFGLVTREIDDGRFNAD